MAILSLPEVDTEPLSDLMLNFLIDHDNEEPYLDFKETIDLSDNSRFAELAKDFLAFLNYGGGFVLLGFRDKSKSTSEEDKLSKRQYIPVGLPESFNIDSANVQTKYNSYCVHPVTILYDEFRREFDGQNRKFAAIFFPASTEVVKAAKSGMYTDRVGKHHRPFSVGDILFRRGTQSIRATKHEKEFIARRILDTQYRLSVLSGRPDPIQESLTSNLFAVSAKDRTISVGNSRDSFYASEDSKAIPWEYVSKRWAGLTVTFEDLSDYLNPLWRTVETGSIRSESLDDWLLAADRRRIVINLLNRGLSRVSKNVGLKKREESWRYYYPCYSDSLSKTWKPRFRESSELLVAKRTYVPRLKKDVWVHLAADANFTVLQDRAYLCIRPTLMLTDDGITPTFGEKEGATITSLLHNRYNNAYLNEVLFWIQQFSAGQGKIELAHGRVSVSAKPAESTVTAGILADRPASEQIPSYVEPVTNRDAP